MTSVAATAIHIGRHRPPSSLDQLDASLEDFEAPPPSRPGSPLLRHENSSNNRHPFGYPSTHSGFRSDSEIGDGDSDSEASAGGYSPPAWRRLGNGDRSSGFWRKSDAQLGGFGAAAADLEELMMLAASSRGSSPEYESADEGERVLAQAVRTRLPGSMSPEKERSPEPEFHAARQYLDEVVRAKVEDAMAVGLGDAPVREKQNCRLGIGLWASTKEPGANGLRYTLCDARRGAAADRTDRYGD
jgi:hypothetical protein